MISGWVGGALPRSPAPILWLRARGGTCWDEQDSSQPRALATEGIPTVLAAPHMTGTRYAETVTWAKRGLMLLFLLALGVMVGCTQSEASTTTTAATSPTQTPASTTSSTSSATVVTSALETTVTTSAPSRDLQVHFIDVGQGDATLILAPDGQAVLIDGGESGSGVLSYLKAQGVGRVNLMIATHPHADHIGGLIDVLQALPVDEVVTNGQAHTTRTYERFLDAIGAARAEYTEVKRGDTISLGGLALDILSPNGPDGQNLNDQSVVVRLAYGKVAFLFSGDAESAAEAGMLAKGQNVQAQILKVGHHGSRSASSPAFLAAIQPEIAVYSSGAGNSYSHPHAETLVALDGVGATIYGTDVDGTVVVTTDGTDYKVEMAKQSQPRAPPTATTTQTPAPALGPLAISVASLSSPISPGATA